MSRMEILFKLLGSLLAMGKIEFQDRRDQVIALNFLKQDGHRQQSWGDYEGFLPSEAI